MYCFQDISSVFTTREAAMLSGSSLSNASKMLKILEKSGLVFKVVRGIWAETGNKKLSVYSVTSVSSTITSRWIKTKKFILLYK